MSVVKKVSTVFSPKDLMEPVHGVHFGVKKLCFLKIAENVWELKDIAALVNVAQGGTKRALFDRIATSGSGVERVDENTFKYSRPAVKGEMGDVGEVIKPPLWVELQGQLVTPVDGIDMATGASFGFYGPMNQENATGGVRHNYLVGETINHCDLDQKVFAPP